MIALLTPGVGHAGEPTNCSEAPKVVEPVSSGSELDAFRGWLNARSMQVPLGALYIVDINNDGADEYVATGSSGKAGNLVLNVFQTSGGEFRPVDDTPKAIADISEGPYSAGVDPVTGTQMLFVRMCGNVYVDLAEDEPFPTEIAYLWKNGEMRPACDSNWVAYRRATFRKLYDQGYYARGETVMRNLIASCQEQIEPGELAGIYGDVARTELKMGKPGRCPDYLDMAAQQEASISGIPAQTNAIGHNQPLCSAPQAVAQPNPDFSWLLDPKLTDTTQVLADPRFENLIAALIPDRSGYPDSLPDQLKFTLEREPSEPKLVAEDGSIAIGAGDGATKESQAMLWLDTRQNHGIFALYDPNASPEFILGSRTVSIEQIPAGFWREYEAWKQQVSVGKEDPDERDAFVGSDGQPQPISAPEAN